MIRKHVQIAILTLATFFIFNSGVSAQLGDGDWLLFPSNLYNCFNPGECQFGQVNFYGSVESDSCTELGYKIDYKLVESFNPTIVLWEKLNTPSTQVELSIWQGDFLMLIRGIDDCGNEAFDTTNFIVEDCGPPYATINQNKAYQVSDTQNAVISAIHDVFDSQFNNCFDIGYIDSLKIKLHDSLEVTDGLTDSLIFTLADTGYQQIQLWEFSWGNWYLSTVGWAHIYSPYDNSISGKVYFDQNKNCHPDDGEPGLPDRDVYFSWVGNKKPADSIGNYRIEYPVPTNPYEQRITGLISTFATGCLQDSFLANTTLDRGDVEIDWGIQLKPDCAELQVDISAPFLRRCFNANYYINYCNAGTLTADSAYIEITFDPFLNIISSTIPWTNVDGQKYTFPIGDVGGGACGDFQVLVEVDCDNTILGQLHCTEAHIYPDETCTDTSGLWGGGNVELRALCDTDSVRFSIKNSGLSPTTIPLDYFIVEDDIIIFFQSFDPLNPGDSILISLPKTGAHYYVQSEQEPFHPFSSSPSAFVEGCSNGTDSISIGYAGQFPINDEEPFLDIDCTENQGSFDPNDKAGLPRGFTENHYVESGQTLEYMIRFQNTGTDTAFTVRIVDTLSPHFLFGTFRPSVASHAYAFNITPDGVATFLFSQIALPDSNTNEMNSHGFIKFEIELRKNLEPGTQITNDAAIYFDFNEPVITNLVNHQVEPDFVKSIFESTVIPSVTILDYWHAEVTPNPITANSIISVTHPFLPRDVSVTIINALGQIVDRLQANSNGISVITAQRLGAGVYFARIEYKGKFATSTRFVKH